MNKEGRVFTNFLWKFGERLSAQLVTLVVSIVLARILEPDAYGVISILMVFISIANVLVVNGFSSALIQKKDADEVDFSSVFYFSVIFSVVLYIGLFIFAPYIAEWYNMPVLCPTLRVLGLRIIVGAVNSVQQAYVSRKMIFRKFFWATLGGTIFSAFVGLIMAYEGFGVWALVGQYLSNTTVNTVVLWYTVKWRPTLVFSCKRLKGLLSYGWKLLASALIGSIYDNLRTLIIGKRYSNEDLAFYSKGKQFPELIMNNVNLSISSVLFPALSKLQDDRTKVAVASRLCVQVSTSVIAPLMLGMAAVAEPLIRLLLTDKWIPAVPYLQICCIYYLMSSIYIAHLQSYKAIGKSGLSLMMESIDAVVGIVLVLIVYKQGVMAVAMTVLLSRGFAFVTCIIYSSRLFNLSIRKLIGDALAPIGIALVMFCIVRLIGRINVHYIALLVIQILAGISIYVALAFGVGLPATKYVKNLLQKKKQRSANH